MFGNVVRLALNCNLRYKTDDSFSQMTIFNAVIPILKRFVTIRLSKSTTL